MNQVLKETIYGKGSREQVDFMIRLGGMDEEEASLFKALHKKKPDEVIRDEMGLSKKQFERIQDCVRIKLTLAIFECINFYRDNYPANE